MSFFKKAFVKSFILVVAMAVLFSLKRGETAPISFENASEKTEVTLISVYDNYQVDKRLKTAWGFATVVKTSQEVLLFDTGGDSEILLSNMKKLGINPASIRKVVISHIHGDHLGGLEGF